MDPNEKWEQFGNVIGARGVGAVCRLCDGTTVSAPDLEINSPNWDAQMERGALIARAPELQRENHRLLETLEELTFIILHKYERRDFLVGTALSLRHNLNLDNLGD